MGQLEVPVGSVHMSLCGDCAWFVRPVSRVQIRFSVGLEEIRPSRPWTANQNDFMHKLRMDVPVLTTVVVLCLGTAGCLSDI